MPYLEFLIAFYSHIHLDIYCFIQTENEAIVLWDGSAFILCENVIVLKVKFLVVSFFCLN